jgi:hydrogenase small subunit
MTDQNTLSLEQRLTQRGVTRRSFLKFCALMSATLALPAAMTPKIARAMSTAATRPPVLWLEFQGCTGDSESLLRVGNPTISQILLEILSVNYHETLMVPSGDLAIKSLNDTMVQYAGQYIAVVEGSVPTGDQRFYCTIGGRPADDILREVCAHAAATISVGTCSTAGGPQAAAPNPTGAVGVTDIIPGLANYVALPGCPMNVTNLAAVIVHYLTYGSLPERDARGRPLFAYGHVIHDICPRRPHFDAGEFALAFGDEGHRAGWCLLKLGCRGPDTVGNCPEIKWNDGTNWPVGAGHPCIGCTGSHFWDAESPFYVPLPL